LRKLSRRGGVCRGRTQRQHESRGQRALPRHQARRQPKIDTQGGTDIEFATIKVARRIGGRTQMVNRDFSFAGTYQNGLQVVEISNPRQPRLVATYDCDLFQGDVQTFARDERTYVTYTNDYDGVDSACFRDLGITGGELPTGTLVIDVTRPSAPRSVGFVEVPAGSHNQTVHPNGRVMYNSNSERTPQGLEVIDLTNLKPPRSPAGCSWSRATRRTTSPSAKTVIVPMWRR